MEISLKPRYSLAEVCRQLNLTPRAVRHYDDLGIVVANRDATNRRWYDQRSYEELALVARLRCVGLGLQEITTVLVAGRLKGEKACATSALSLVERRRRRLMADLHDLTALEARLSAVL